MSLVFQLESGDVLFDEVHSDKIILNDIDGSTKESKKFIDDMLIRNHLGDTLSLIPTCMCGHYEGTFHVGIKCEVCNTVVETQLDEKLAYLLWIRQPKGVARLISPFLLNSLVKRYFVSSPKVSLVTWMITARGQNPGRLPNAKIEGFINALKAKNIPLGYNSFIENFLDVIEILEKNFSSAKNKKDREKFLNFIKENMDNIFSKHLAIPNRAIFMFDSNEVGTFMDKDLLDAISVVRKMTSIDLMEMSSQARQYKTATALIEYGSFFEDYSKETFYGKGGIVRKQISRTRSPFTMRAVVISNSRVHDLRDIYLPWSGTVSMLREHIIGGLFKRGYSIKRATDHFYRHIKKYDPLIHQIILRVIETADGIPCLMNRNPSLGNESIQFLRARGVKTDPRDNAITVSYLLSKAYNMDFDGDMLNLLMLMTKEMIEEATNFDFHHNILDLSAPNKFGPVLGLPKTNICTIANWLKR